MQAPSLFGPALLLLLVPSTVGCDHQQPPGEQEDPDVTMEIRLVAIAELGRPGHTVITRREDARCEFPPVEEVFGDAVETWDRPMEWAEVFVYDVVTDWSVPGHELPAVAIGSRTWFEGHETYADGDPTYTNVGVYEGIQPDCGDVVGAEIAGALSGVLLTDAELADFGHGWDHERVRKVIEDYIAEMERTSVGPWEPAGATERNFLVPAE